MSSLGWPGTGSIFLTLFYLFYNNVGYAQHNQCEFLYIDKKISSYEQNGVSIMRF